jgi:hypothetical protein
MSKKRFDRLLQDFLVGCLDTLVPPLEERDLVPKSALK